MFGHRRLQRPSVCKCCAHEESLTRQRPGHARAQEADKGKSPETHPAAAAGSGRFEEADGRDWADWQDAVERAHYARFEEEFEDDDEVGRGSCCSGWPVMRHAWCTARLLSCSTTALPGKGMPGH